MKLPDSKNYIKLSDLWSYNDKNEDIGPEFSTLIMMILDGRRVGIFRIVDTGTFPSPGLQTALNKFHE